RRSNKELERRNRESMELLAKRVPSAIESLPTELLELIFLETSRCTQSFPKRRSALDVRSFPWAAGKVCSQWRALVLSLPALWSEVTLVIDQPTPRDGRNVEVWQYKCIPLPSNLIGGCSERWKIASVRTLLDRALLAQINDRLPLLEALDWFHFPSLLAKTIVAPSLRDLTLGTASFTRSFPQWAQLEKIHLCNHPILAPILDELRVLQSSPNLQQLSITSEFPILCQPELKFANLHILECPAFVLDAFLELPRLEKLTLLASQFKPTSVQLSFPLFTGPLNLPCNLDSMMLINIVEKFPALESLDLTCAHAADSWHAIVKYLTVDPSRPHVAALPHLHCIRIRTSNKNQMVRCIKMLESRFSSQYDLPRLKSVKWFGWDQLQKPGTAIKKRLDELKQQGLEVNVSAWSAL
ncbi:hypothetical protein C8J56DRAFT_935811, partial [Mycena floridula]